MKKILVPVDGSEGANHALVEARKIATALNSEVVVFHASENIMGVNNSKSVYENYKDTLDSNRTIRANKILNDAKTFFDGCDISVQFATEPCDAASPAGCIIEFADQIGADTIIMGNRGLGGLSRILLGSVAQKVLNTCHCSVIIVK
jgi:nucleotide-binding universal stress UspA family protein